MNLSGLLDDYPEIEEEIGGLSQEDSARFQRLFAKRCQKLSLPLIIVACLGIYCVCSRSLVASQLQLGIRLVTNAVFDSFWSPRKSPALSARKTKPPNITA